MSFQAVVNIPQPSRPTGELGGMQLFGNPPIPYATGPGVAISGNYGGGAYQQINVGDVMCSYQDATYGAIAIPVAAVPAAAGTTSNSAASKLTLQQIHGAALEAGQGGSGTVYGFLGIAASYRDANDSSYGRSHNRIGIIPKARIKARVVPGDANFTNFLPAGTLVGAAVNGMSTGSSAFVATPIPGYVQTSQACASSSNIGGLTYAGTTAAGTTTPLTASEAIGRLAYDKQASDTFVWVDIVSTILEGGVQNTNTST